MRSYRKPGVYFEWAPPPTPGAGVGVRMDVAGFVGIAARGEIGKPVRLESWSEFVATFGAPIPQGHLGPAVAGFFANGGKTCWVARAADPALAEPASAAILDPDGKPLIRLIARTPGFWAHDLVVSLIPRGAHSFDLTLVLPGAEYETWRNLTLPTWKGDASPTRIDAVINENSRLVKAHRLYKLPKDGAPADGIYHLKPHVAAGAEAVPVRLIASAFHDAGAAGHDAGAAGHDAGAAGRDGGGKLGIDRRRTTNLQGGIDGIAAQAMLRDRAGKTAVQLLRTDLSLPTGAVCVQVERSDPARRRFTLALGARSGGPDWRVSERFDLSVDPDDPDWYPLRLNDLQTGSRLVAAVLPPATDAPPPTPDTTGPTPLLGGLDLVHLLGSDPFAPYDPDMAGEPAGGLERLGWVPEIAMVAVPDLMPSAIERPPPPRRRCAPPPPVRLSETIDADDLRPYPVPFTADQIAAAQERILLHCQLKADRLAILDSPAGAKRLNEKGRAATSLVLDERAAFTSGWGALYFPWLVVPDGDGGPATTLPPCGHVAGIYARVEARLGIASAPANQLLDGVSDVCVRVDDATAGDLNVSGVNVISADRSGVRICGARTLWRADGNPATILDDDTPDTWPPGGKPWRYVSVRRLATMIGRAIAEAGQWTVFEPNDRRLWRDLERVARGLLDELWRAGMLDGELPEDAYFVRCDDATNPPAQVAAGMVVCQIGLQPPLPAEFVIIRIGRTENATRMVG